MSIVEKIATVLGRDHASDLAKLRSDAAAIEAELAEVQSALDEQSADIALGLVEDASHTLLSKRNDLMDRAAIIASAEKTVLARIEATKAAEEAKRLDSEVRAVRAVMAMLAQRGEALDRAAAEFAKAFDSVAEASVKLQRLIKPRGVGSRMGLFLQQHLGLEAAGIWGQDLLIKHFGKRPAMKTSPKSLASLRLWPCIAAGCRASLRPSKIRLAAGSNFTWTSFGASCRRPRLKLPPSPRLALSLALRVPLPAAICLTALGQLPEARTATCRSLSLEAS
jgi:hypothetical protein